jgi:hypothetical protein
MVATTGDMTIMAKRFGLSRNEITLNHAGGSFSIGFGTNDPALAAEKRNDDGAGRSKPARA